MIDSFLRNEFCSIQAKDAHAGISAVVSQIYFLVWTLVPAPQGVFAADVSNYQNHAHPLGSGSVGGDAVNAKIMSIVRVGMALTLCSEASVSNGGLKSRGVTSRRNVVSAICGSF